MKLQQLPPEPSTPRTALHPTPDTQPRHPWRFCLNDELYLFNEPTPLRVVGGRLHRGFPHYHLQDLAGREYTYPQLWLSRHDLPPSARQ